MYLRAGLFSLGLLLLSRVLGLARESVQAAAFGSTGMGDVVIVMFTLPDLLVGIFLSGALGYVLLPHWAQQTRAAQQSGQQKMALILASAGVLASIVIWLLRDVLVTALAPGLQGEMRALGVSSLVWSAAVLPLAMLAALWTTRLQHERDFVGMYAGNLVVNGVLVSALFLLAGSVARSGATVSLGACLLLAMAARLAWLVWRLRADRQAGAASSEHPPGTSATDALPSAGIWIWAALSSGLLLLLPLTARSIASQGGEGSLASFNYAWKLVELPLVLAVQLVASLAFPAIARTKADTPERDKALQLAFLLAWSLACAAIAVVATFSLPLSGLLFGWGRMSPDKLALIAGWSAIGVWSLLPQALIAVLLTVMASAQRMHAAVWAYAAGLLALLGLGMLGAGRGSRGAEVMWMLDAVLAGVALVLMMAERRSVASAFPWFACLVPLAVCIALTSLKPWLADLGAPLTMMMSCFYGLLVMGSAVASSPSLRDMITARFRRTGRVKDHP
jgi:putative peptidoglycan lipid II flippase